METVTFSPVMMMVVLLFAQVFIMEIQETKGQNVPMEYSPSFHRVQFSIGPDGRADMGGYGSELDQFFGGSGSGRGRSGGNNGVGGMFRPRFAMGRRPRFFWRSFRF
ncbi:hypothetical protein ACF0H5_022490 [Mactra antiquata]